MRDLSNLKTVMLIDDDSLDQMIHERVIKRSGLFEKTIPFTYADKALEYLKAPDCEKIDIIFLDVNMPKMNGFEFLDRATNDLKPNSSKAVIIILTSSLNPHDTERAEAYSVVSDYIVKPLTPDVLIRAVRLSEGLE